MGAIDYIDILSIILVPKGKKLYTVFVRFGNVLFQKISIPLPQNIFPTFLPFLLSFKKLVF